VRDWANFFTDDEIRKVWQEPITLANATKYLNAKIREALEAAPKVYGNVGEYASSWSTYPIGTFIQENNTHTARLVDVKPIKKGE